MTPAQPATRPLPVTAIALVQFAKAAFLLAVATIPLFGGEGRLAYIPNLRAMLFLASHGRDPDGLLPLFLGIYAAYLGLGLLRLKRWARDSLVFSSGLMLIFWLAHYNFGTTLLIMPAASAVTRDTVYVLLTLDLAIFVYLKFHTEIAQSFAPRPR